MATPAHCPHADWDPRDPSVQADQIAAYDRLRDTLGVARSEMLGWSVFGHADVLRALHDPQAFSSAVSRHVAVPNGMDPPEHTRYRALIDPYFNAERVQAFEPRCAAIAQALALAMAGQDTVDLASAYALPFAVHVQCAFMGWPAQLHAPLADWIARHHRASLAQDRPALAALGQRFERRVAALLQERREQGAGPEQDATARLMHERVDGQPLSDAHIASIVRNWTVGEIGTIAAAVGIVAHWLAHHADLQAQLRAEPERHDEAIDEILRLHGPLVANRRISACPVQLGGRSITAGDRVVLHWTSANRDPRVFDAPGTFRWGRKPQDNLLYGAGIHVCPGAPLARMELRVALRALLAHAPRLAPLPGQPPHRAQYPAMGFDRLPLRLR